MNEKDRELMSYLERISKHLSNYPDIEENIKHIIYYIDQTRKALLDVKIEKKETHQNHLTFEDILLLAKEVLGQIEPTYLPMLDHMIEDGTLDLDYYHANEDERYLCIYPDSQFVYEPKNGRKSINIIREMNYDDVILFIHEFMHYANFQPIVSKKRTLFTEFFSIYFELYATKYLIEQKGISTLEININERIVSMLRHLQDISKYEYAYLSYLSFGTIDIEAFNHYFATYKQKEYEFERDYSLDYFHRVEKKGYTVEDSASSDLKYGLGSMLAYWAIENVEKDQVLSFYKDIYNIENRDMPLNDLLHKYGFHLTEKFPEEVKESIENFLALQEKNLKHL